jgi:hypothetical protein
LSQVVEETCVELIEEAINQSAVESQFNQKL